MSQDNFWILGKVTEDRLISLHNDANESVELVFPAGDNVRLGSEKLNHPPVLEVPDTQFVETKQIVSIDAFAYDVDSDPLSFSWVEISDSGIPFQANGPQLVFIAPDNDAQLEFQVTVSDGRALVSKTVRIIVEQANSDDYNWTDITPGPNAQIIYVSPHGDDGADGTENSPLRSVAAAVNKINSGNGNQIRLLANSTYDVSVSLDKNDIVISSYGEGKRPKILGSFTLTGPNAGSNLIFKGLDFRASTKYEGNAIRAVTDNFDNVIIEDCFFIHYKEPLLIQADTPNFSIENVKIRRCFLLENGDKSPIDGSLNTPDRKNKRSSGMYISRAKQIVIEDSVIAYCGFTSYDPAVRSQYNPDLGYRANASIYSHGIYNQYSTFNDSILRNCVIIEPASHGVQVRAGGDILGNVFYRCPIGFLLGNEWSNSAETDQPIIGKVNGNAVFDAVDMNYADKRGWLGELQQCKTVEFCDNIIVNDTQATDPRGLILGSSKINGSSYTIKNNIVNWTNPFYLVGKIDNLVFEGNTFYNSWRNTKDIGINGIQIPRSAGKWQNTDVQPKIENLSQSNNTGVNTRLPNINEVIPDFEAKIIAQVENGWNVNMTAQNIIQTYRSYISGN